MRRWKRWLIIYTRSSIPRWSGQGHRRQRGAHCFISRPLRSVGFRSALKNFCPRLLEYVNEPSKPKSITDSDIVHPFIGTRQTGIGDMIDHHRQTMVLIELITQASGKPE
jgi:hypothetical protein